MRLAQVNAVEVLDESLRALLVHSSPCSGMCEDPLDTDSSIHVDVQHMSESH